MCSPRGACAPVRWRMRHDRPRRSSGAHRNQVRGIVLERAHQLQLTGGSSSGPLTIRSVSLGRVPARELRRQRQKQLIDEPVRRAAGRSGGGRPRTASVCTPKRSRSSAIAPRQIERAVARAAHIVDLGAAILGQARRRRGQDRHARAGFAQQRDLAVQGKAPRDDARQRLLGEAALAPDLSSARRRASAARSARREPCPRPPSPRRRPCAARTAALCRRARRAAPSVRRGWRGRRRC